MAFGTGLDLSGIWFPSVDQSMTSMAADGVSYVHVSAPASMRTRHFLIHYKITLDANIRFQIRVAKRHGLNVFFKPVLPLDSAV